MKKTIGLQRSVKTTSKKINTAKGRHSFDMTTSNTLVSFINRNSTPYPTEIGGPNFDLVPVRKQKDKMLNVARLHAQQEYNRIMDLVAVLESQAQEIKHRLEITDAVYEAEYDFEPVHGTPYWLVYDNRKKVMRLCMNGPNDWSTAPPEGYEYITQVKWLGDYTWIEITE